jgi:NAD(P)-dependent dehydrogenase (short-subunit alcohol dehydrogenase family)
VIRRTTGLAKDVAKESIRVNCLAPSWIASDGPRQYWESLTPGERKERGVPLKAAGDAGDRRDGPPPGLRRIVERARRFVVVGRPAAPHSVGRPGLP